MQHHARNQADLQSPAWPIELPNAESSFPYPQSRFRGTAMLLHAMTLTHGLPCSSCKRWHPFCTAPLLRTGASYDLQPHVSLVGWLQRVYLQEAKSYAQRIAQNRSGSITDKADFRGC